MTIVDRATRCFLGIRAVFQRSQLVGQEMVHQARAELSVLVYQAATVWGEERILNGIDGIHATLITDHNAVTDWLDRGGY